MKYSAGWMHIFVIAKLETVKQLESHLSNFCGNFLNENCRKALDASDTYIK